MTELSSIDIVGFWLGIFLTFCILSFLYKDNPFYKFAEHLFIGTSIGYLVIQQYYNTLEPKLFDPLLDGDQWWGILHWSFIPLVLTALMFVKAFSKRYSWMGRYPLAFVVALYAGIQINGQAEADLAKQVEVSIQSFDKTKVNINIAPKKQLMSLPGVSSILAEAMIERRVQKPFSSLDEIQSISGLPPKIMDNFRESRGAFIGLDANASVVSGERDYFGIVSNIFLLLGLLASLVYFYFSVEHKGVIGKISRFGVFVLMIGFGAAFGFTVQGRLALAVGRVQDIRGDQVSEIIANQVQGPWVALISIVFIVGGLILWERRNPTGESQG